MNAEKRGPGTSDGADMTVDLESGPESVRETWTGYRKARPRSGGRLGRSGVRILKIQEPGGGRPSSGRAIRWSWGSWGDLVVSCCGTMALFHLTAGTALTLSLTRTRSIYLICPSR